MAYDQDLVDRIRALPLDGVVLDERSMFGGLAFLLFGNMAFAASGEGGLMVRADPDDVEAFVACRGAARMEMRGRAMTGWLRVDADAVADDVDLAEWVTIGLRRAGELPPK